jgi:hypothetical protein
MPSLSEIGTFLSGVAAAAIPIWAVTLWLFNRFFKQKEKELTDATTASVQRLIRDRMLSTIEDLDPQQFYTLDVNFRDGMSMTVPMIPRKPLHVLENITLEVIDHNSEVTLLFLRCDGFGHIGPHHHAFTCETLEIRSGIVTHLETGKQYRTGDVWVIPAGEVHSATFQDCTAFVTHRPSLPTAKERPVDLEQMGAIFKRP